MLLQGTTAVSRCPSGVRRAVELEVSRAITAPLKEFSTGPGDALKVTSNGRGAEESGKG